MTTKPQELLKQIDQINEKIKLLDAEKTTIYNKLAIYKKEIEFKHRHLIGKKAMCRNTDSEKEFQCECVAVMALDDYENVKPLFNKGNKKHSVDYYEWIN